MIKRPLIIDTDPGVDDAECLMLVQGSGKFDIRGITAVHGNVPLSATANNALFLSKMYGIDCPVYKGAENALIARKTRAEFVHGVNGMASFDTTLPEGAQFAEGHAWDFIWEEAVAQNGELEILALGPLTNLAIAVMKHPELPKLVKNLVIMGGAAGNGNAGVYTEFNVGQDPHACDIILQAGFANLTMVDLNACGTAFLNKEECEKLAALGDKNTFGPLATAMLKKEEVFRTSMESRGKTIYNADRHTVIDGAAGAILIDPSIAQTVDKFVTCDVVGELTTGQTIIDWLGFAPFKNVHWTLGLDREAFVKLYFDCLKSYDKGDC